MPLIASLEEKYSLMACNMSCSADKDSSCFLLMLRCYYPYTTHRVVTHGVEQSQIIKVVYKGIYSRGDWHCWMLYTALDCRRLRKVHNNN